MPDEFDQYKRTVKQDDEFSQYKKTQIDGGRTLTPRQRLAPTRLESALQNVGQQISAFPTPSPIDQFGKEMFQTGIGGIQKMVEAFQPPTTQALAKDPLGRIIESGGRGGEFGLGAAGLLSAPFAPILNRLPFQKEIDRGLNAIIEKHPLYPVGKAFAESRQIPEVVETVKDINKVGVYGAATGGIAKGIGGIKKFVVEKPTRLVKSAAVDFDRALPTITKELTRPQDRNRLAPYLVEEHTKSPLKMGERDLSAIRQLAEEKIPNIKNRIYSEQDVLIQRNKDVPIIGGVESIARNIESLRNIYTKNIDILKDASILDEANKYRNLGNITLSEARELQRSLNASLQEFYKKSSESQVAAENMAKPIAEMEKAAQALRNQIVKTLNFVGEDGGWYREKSLDYGAAAKLEAAAERNITKAESPLPPFFTTTQSTFYPSRPGLIREVGEHTVGRFYTPDKLIVRAIEKYSKAGLTPPKGVPQKGQTNVGGLLPPPALVTPPPVPARSGLNPPVGTQYMPQIGQRLLPPPSTRIAPEYSRTAPQQADFMQLIKGKYQPDINKLKAIVKEAGGIWKGISDMGERGGKWLMFDEPTGSTLALPLNEVSIENIKSKIKGYAAKREVPKK